MLISEKVMGLEAENRNLKEEIGRLQQLYGDDYKPKRCQECRFFFQHYVRCEGVYIKINEGHCTAGARTKNRAADKERCQFFQGKIL